ncbi:Pimeloyl-ACP methyl ester carboxylesterase [Reichenbachiella faecimaris]|uniref:Pimeloyl-ACP methyl ester carboxylesterase n=1 Tax=Reichenbachiella faecimaris TaxID=692418 RepID=A0A1W2G7D6_REIFA|nr:alpha/beta fold hydrolase [Reichenbachiella faecimaris]SMD32258.1 Pimeloyl-ACP methyl ester carboxylesterase [Reichenbachiella faecimaris]
MKPLIILLLGTYCLHAQHLTGRFEGAVSREGSIQLVNFDFYVAEGMQKATYEIPEIGSFDVPIDRIELKNDTLHIKFYYGNFFCFVNEQQEVITGISENWNPKIRLHVKKTATREKPYKKEEISFANGAIQLAGMIYQPTKPLGKTTNYVILVHGSGAQYRSSPYYISLGYRLAKNGIGVLLYDKRGTGHSMGNFENASIETLANDALAALDYLVGRKDFKTGEIGFLGTSQGGWIAPMAANKSKDCDFLILNVGPAVSMFQQDIHRVANTMQADGWKQVAVDSAITYTELYFQYVKDNSKNTYAILDAYWDDIKNKDWVEYVNSPEVKEDIDWWRKNDYDPEMTLKNIKCRTLSLFAEFDPLVPPKENTALMRTYLDDAQVNYEVKIIEGAIHDMNTFQGLKGGQWNWPKAYWEWRKQPEPFLKHILQFINGE